MTVMLGAASTAAVLAQGNVYSLNIVGYINQTIPSGFSMLANQLQASDQKVTALIPAPPENTAVFKFNPATGGYLANTFVDGAWEGDDLNMTLGSGEGVFISAPSQFVNTFVGEIRLNSTNAVKTGFSIMSSPIPQSAAIDTVLGYPAGEGDSIFQFNPATGGYIADTFVDGAWEGDSGGSAPAQGVGKEFFVFNNGAQKNWVRNFSVGN